MWQSNVVCNLGWIVPGDMASSLSKSGIWETPQNITGEVQGQPACKSGDELHFAFKASLASRTTTNLAANLGWNIPGNVARNLIFFPACVGWDFVSFIGGDVSGRLVGHRVGMHTYLAILHPGSKFLQAIG